MSMLSSMCDRLRKTADKVESFWYRNSKWLWIDASTITRAVVELRDAADTIDYLRRTCNDLQRENEKLKALIRDMWHDGICDCDEFRACAQGQYHCAECEYGYLDRMRELGIEVEE
jgi:hypothetical protein